MTQTVEAVYQDGQLKFKEPVVLAEGTAVRVTITPIDEDEDPLAGLIGICKTGRTDGAENHDKYIYGKRPRVAQESDRGVAPPPREDHHDDHH